MLIVGWDEDWGWKMIRWVRGACGWTSMIYIQASSDSPLFIFLFDDMTFYNCLAKKAVGHFSCIL